MTSVAPIPQDQDFADAAPAAQEMVDAAALDAQLAEVKTAFNALLTAAGRVIRDDDTLVDGIVRLRNIHNELAELIGSKSGWQPLVACALATTANLTLTGEQTIDGVLTSATRILVKDQTDPTQNGIYVTGAGAWTRAADAATALALGYAAVAVLNGTANARTAWVQTIAGAAITLGTTGLVWAKFGGDSVILDGAVTQTKLATDVFYTVDTVAALKALTKHPDTVLVRGYAAAGDLGAGIYRWNAADSSTDNGGTVIAPNAGGTGRWNRILQPVLDVRAFGARGDGTTNDTAAVQSALTIVAALVGTLRFNAGTYKAATTLTVPVGVMIDMDEAASVLFTGTGPAFKFTGRHWEERHRIRVDTTGNGNANVDHYAFAGGISRSVLELYSKGGAETRHGIVLYGVNPDTSVANNNQYSNRIRYITEFTVMPSGIGVYLKGTEGVADSVCNANWISGNVDFATCVYVMGNGNTLNQLIVNESTVAAVQFEGSATYANLLVGCYFDSAIAGDIVRLGPDNHIAGNYVFTAVACIGLQDETKVTNDVVAVENVHFGIIGQNAVIVPRSAQDLPAGARSGAQIYSGDLFNDTILQMRQGVHPANARVVLAGKDFVGTVDRVSNKGGASVVMFDQGVDNPDTEYRWIITTDGVADTVIGRIRKVNGEWGLVLGTGGRGDWWGTAAPSGGAWAKGDRVKNSSGTAGDPAGWVCTAAGSPGTWATFGQLSYRTHAGTPSASVTPNFIGEDLLDTTNNRWYRSYGLTNTSWSQLSN